MSQNRRELGFSDWDTFAQGQRNFGPVPLRAAGHNMGSSDSPTSIFDDLMSNTLGKPIVEWFK
jgi:hypothetical protein